MSKEAVRTQTLLAAGAIALVVISLMVAGCLQPVNPGIPGENITNTSPVVSGLPVSQQEPIRTTYSPGDITNISAEALRTANESLNAIAALPPEKRTFESTVIQFDKVMSDLFDNTNPVLFMGYVYPDPSVVAESMKSWDESNAFLIATYTRRDLYDALKDQVPGNPGEARLYEVTIRIFEKNGLALPEDRLAKVRSLKSELSRLETQYAANLNKDNTTLEFTPEELEGVPPEALAAFSKTDRGTYLVTLKYTDSSSVMSNANRSETRRRMASAVSNIQAEENTRLLEDAIVLRQQIARELGYTSWADYQIEGRMAGSAGNVTAFLQDLREPLQEKNSQELTELLAIKRNLSPGAVSVDPWDISYLYNKQRKQLYSYDNEEVRRYFPLGHVVQEMFSIFGPMFGVRFEEVKGAPAWAPEVTLFRVSNITDGKTVGFLYLDPYPREGKYSGMAEFGIINGRMNNGTYTTPVVAIVGNFRPPENNTPSLLRVGEVFDLFHETGHATHALLTRAPYGSLSGTSVERDFLETPSQALEEWVYDPEILESISGNYTNTSEKIPKDLRDRIIASRNLGNGGYYSYQLMSAMEDMIFHTAEGPVNVTEVSDSLYGEMIGIPPIPGGHDAASFSHVMGGYDAGYYGYLWSKVYALNIVEKFKQDGMRNETTGMKFRKDILEQGNMQDGMVLLKDFLGKEPNTDVLYSYMGITPSAG